jgi:hypothetical protein
MPTLMFKVLVPAMMPMPPAGVQPDANQVYMGSAMMPNGMFTPAFGNAVVTGGAKVGDTWYGCTYFAPPYVIPGFGQVQQLP